MSAKKINFFKRTEETRLFTHNYSVSLWPWCPCVSVDPDARLDWTSISSAIRLTNTALACTDHGAVREWMSRIYTPEVHVALRLVILRSLFGSIPTAAAAAAAADEWDGGGGDEKEEKKRKRRELPKRPAYEIDRLVSAIVSAIRKALGGGSDAQRLSCGRMAITQSGLLYTPDAIGKFLSLDSSSSSGIRSACISLDGGIPHHDPSFSFSSSSSFAVSRNSSCERFFCSMLSSSSSPPSSSSGVAVSLNRGKLTAQLQASTSVESFWWFVSEHILPASIGGWIDDLYDRAPENEQPFRLTSTNRVHDIYWKTVIAKVGNDLGTTTTVLPLPLQSSSSSSSSSAAAAAREMKLIASVSGSKRIAESSIRDLIALLPPCFNASANRDAPSHPNYEARYFLAMTAAHAAIVSGRRSEYRQILQDAVGAPLARVYQSTKGANWAQELRQAVYNTLSVFDKSVSSGIATARRPGCMNYGKQKARVCVWASSSSSSAAGSVKPAIEDPLQTEFLCKVYDIESTVIADALRCGGGDERRSCRMFCGMTKDARKSSSSSSSRPLKHIKLSLESEPEPEPEPAEATEKKKKRQQQQQAPPPIYIFNLSTPMDFINYSISQPSSSSSSSSIK